MEKKTIGSFIAALRKANGLTQKELAEKLGVSDKAVSRWEREETLPDLSLIPVLAEIFDVSCDELLKGQRITKTAQDTEGTATKNEKQIEYFLNCAKVKYQIHSIVSIGLTLMGCLVSLLINFGLLRSYIGFWAGCAFFTAAVLCQIVFSIQAKAQVQGYESSEASHGEYLAYINRFGTKVAIGILCGFCATLPLLSAGDTYRGVSWGFLFPHSLAYILLVIALYKIIPIIFQFLRRRRNHESLSAVEKFIIKRICIIILIPVITLTLLFGFSSVDSTVFVQPITYDTWDAFKSAIETPVTPWGEALTFLEYRPDEHGEFDCCEMIGVYTLADGYIYELPIYPPEEVLDANQNVLCSFRHLNLSIRSIWPNTENTETKLPVACYSEDAFRQVDLIREKITIVLLVACAAAILYYILNTAKSAKKLQSNAL